MRNALIILLSLINLVASATDYYVSASGNDAANGLTITTPWKTIAKVNSAFSVIKPGDRILFNRGDTFYGTINIAKSGITGSPITIGACGSGEKPIITGFTAISEWTNEGNGIYSKVITSESQINMVTIDGVNTGMGRYPNSGTWLTYESHNANLSITDNQLTGTPNWTGAEAVIRKTKWMLDRNIITDHTSTTLTYTAGSSAILEESGYFIQNSLGTLDVFGEWYSNGTKLYMYFGAVNPTTRTVKITTIDYLVNISYFNSITFDNVCFEGANLDAFVIQTGQNIIIQNCSLTFLGEDGIRTTDASNGSSIIIDNNIMNNINQCAIHLRGISNYGWIKNNTITNIGIIPGTGTNKYADDWGDGIVVYAANTLVEYNSLMNIGHSGIAFRNGSGIIIRNNLVTNFALTRYDAGGIYTLNGVGVIPTGQKIQNNIVLNGKNTSEGIGGNTYLSIWGIYLDANSINIEVSGNTTANCSTAGLFLLRAANIKVNHNTFYNNGSQIQFQFKFGTTLEIRGCDIEDNVFFAKDANQLTLKYESTANDIAQFGIANNNYYARPNNEDITFYTYDPINGAKYRNLTGWQSFTHQDANSHKSPIALTNINDIRFEYNTSKTNKIISLAQPMIDVKGIKYVNSIALLPFTSVVLMVDPNPAPPVIPLYTSSVINNATPSLLEINYDVSLSDIVPASSVFTVQVNSVPKTVNAIAISGTKVKLTLSSPVVYEDIITVSYSKPSTNPLQTTSGGQASSFIPQSVTNNVVSLTLPTCTSSSIENTTPSLLVLNYNMTLANISPAASSFSVKVNSVARTVTAVTISETKVSLTLASPIVSGDVMTVSYTKPASNQLQTITGMSAASITNQPVTNNCINIAPTVAITSPIINSIFTSPANITITANATDADGTVILVEFYNGSIKLGSKSEAPYSFTWNNVAAGTYYLTAIATDNLKAKAFSSAISISIINGSTIVNQPPNIIISNPLKGNKYFPNSTITIDATAVDPDGLLSKVEFYNGTVKLVELTSAPYTYTWKDVAAGSYTITAHATDNLNATTVSSPVEFVVGNIVKYDANSAIIKLYPNPSYGHFSIEFMSPLRNEKSEIIITDQAGKQVYFGSITKEETLKQFDLSNSKEGIYIMMIKDKDILVTKKIIIQ